jgi:leader peptidase (prepilin peptidase)/N-methyltransferase
MMFLVIFLLVNAFILGTIVGSLLNVCIYRLPLEKSILWPGSRCSHCLQPIRWYSNIPLVSYLWLRGRCRTCGARFSSRYFLIELLTGLIFAGLFYLEVLDNIHGFQAFNQQGFRLQRLLMPTWQGWVVFGYHAIFVSFLIVATFCDFDQREIPLSLTVTGTVIGLIGAGLFPWPWPDPPPVAFAPNQPPPLGLYPWPVWLPLPGWLPPGSWQLGLATGLVGALAGTVMLRVVRFVFTAGLGVEALGLGDADLMMMAGAFLGWQPLVVAFFISVGPGLLFALFHAVYNRLATRKKITIRALALLKDGQVLLELDGQTVQPDQGEAAIAALVKEQHKSVFLLDPSQLEGYVEELVQGVRAETKQAGIRHIHMPGQDMPPGFFSRLLSFVRGGHRPTSTPAIQVEVAQQNGKPAIRVNGEPVPQEELRKHLAALAAGKRGVELIIDSSGLEKWLGQAMTAIRLAARQAGAEKIHVHDRTIPFGPALAVGLVIAMLCWKDIGNKSWFVFFHPWLIFGAAGVCCILMFACSYFIRVTRMMRQ